MNITKVCTLEKIFVMVAYTVSYIVEDPNLDCVEKNEYFVVVLFSTILRVANVSDSSNESKGVHIT